jgi:LysR family glycine cleavage system transcriptional activator
MRWYLVYRGFQREQRDFVAFRRWIVRAATEPAGRDPLGAARIGASAQHRQVKT